MEADNTTASEKEAPPAKRRRLPRPVLFIALAIVVVAAGVGGAFALGLLGGGDHAEEAVSGTHDDDADRAHAPTPGYEPIFVDIPDLVVNLVVQDGRPRFLKLSVAVEVAGQKTAERIGQLMPRIVDSFQLYLRTLTPAELQGPGAMFRLKEGLHVRVDEAIGPERVGDVLFKEMLVQ